MPQPRPWPWEALLLQYFASNHVSLTRKTSFEKTHSMLHQLGTRLGGQGKKSSAEKRSAEQADLSLHLLLKLSSK